MEAFRTLCFSLLKKRAKCAEHIYVRERCELYREVLGCSLPENFENQNLEMSFRAIYVLN